MAYWDRDDIQTLLAKWHRLVRVGTIAPAEHRHALEQLARAVELELRTQYPHPPDRAAFNGLRAGSADGPRDTATRFDGVHAGASTSNAPAASPLQVGM